jgi:signal transduction histidine kinase
VQSEIPGIKESVRNMIAEHEGRLAEGRENTTAAFIRMHQDEIIACWEERVRALPATRELERAMLVEPIADVLSRIADATEAVLANAPPTTWGSELHAIARVDQGWDLTTLVMELGILRSCISAQIANQQIAHVRTLDEVIDSTLTSTIDCFSRARDRRLHTLDELAAAALASRSFDELLRRLLEILVHASDAIDIATILVREDSDWLRARASVGIDERTQQRIRIGESFAGTIAATRAPLELADAAHDALLRRSALSRVGARALYGIPLVEGNDVIAVAYIGSLTVERFSAEDKRLFSAATERATSAIFQHMLRETAERTARELRRREDEFRFLDAAAKVLSSSLDYDDTLQRISQLVVPELADWCIVDLVEPYGRVRRVAAQHIDPAKAALAHEWERRYPQDLNANTGVPHVLRTGQPELYTEISDQRLVDYAVDAEHLQLLRELGLASCIIAPLQARGRTLGTITLVTTESGRKYTQSDLDLVMELGRRAGMAVDNARLYRESQRSLRERQDAVRSRDEVLAIVSHDLRSPLNAIGMSAALLEEQCRDAEWSKQLALVRRSADRMEHMIDDLLDTATIQAHGLALRRKPEPIEPLLAAVTDAHRLEASRVGIELRRECQPLPGQVSCDRERIERVFANLIGNALKYCRPGDVVAIRGWPLTGEVQFSVADSGPGIPPELLPHLFEPYWSRKRRSASSGTGLGLYIVRGIVEAHGGRLWVESKPARGSEFFFTLPLA